MALAALCLVAVVRHAPGPTALAQGETIVDKINDQFMKRMEAKQRKADLETVKDAAHVNQLFGGSFSDGVGSNTWAHTPFQKYDYKDRAHMESLKEVEPAKEQEAAKCMELAKAFKGARRAGAMKVTMAEKEEARKCAAFVMAQRKGWKARTAKKLAIDTSMPKFARPHEVHIYKPDKALLGRRAKFEKKAKKLEAQREAAKAAAREAAMHPHIIKAHHFFPRGKKAGHSAKVLKEAKKARKELSKMPSFVNSQSFDDRQGARSRDAKEVAAKLNFWENMGSEKEKLATSQGRSKTEYVVTDPMAGARKAQKTSSLLLQKTTMLLQDPDMNARPYYTASNMGPRSEWSGYGQELASQQDGGNPYAKGWRDLKMNQGVEGIYRQINKNLEPLAEQYPYLRAVRH
jgi:hypothetical protein